MHIFILYLKFIACLLSFPHIRRQIDICENFQLITGLLSAPWAHITFQILLRITNNVFVLKQRTHMNTSVLKYSIVPLVTTQRPKTTTPRQSTGQSASCSSSRKQFVTFQSIRKTTPPIQDKNPQFLFFETPQHIPTTTSQTPNTNTKMSNTPTNTNTANLETTACPVHVGSVYEYEDEDEPCFNSTKDYCSSAPQGFSPPFVVLATYIPGPLTQPLHNMRGLETEGDLGHCDPCLEKKRARKTET